MKQTGNPPWLVNHHCHCHDHCFGIVIASPPLLRSRVCQYLYYDHLLQMQLAELQNHLMDCKTDRVLLPLASVLGSETHVCCILCLGGQLGPLSLQLHQGHQPDKCKKKKKGTRKFVIKIGRKKNAIHKQGDQQVCQSTLADSTGTVPSPLT